MNRSVKKAFALAVMLAALTAIIIGIGNIGNCKDQHPTRKLFSTDSVVVPPKAYGHLLLDVNESGDYEFIFNLNGTLRADYTPESNYLSWINGSYKPLFSREMAPNTEGAGVYMPVSNSYAEPTYLVLWNTNSSSSVEVKIAFYKDSTEMFYNNFNFYSGILLTAAGVVSSLAAAFSISRRVLLTVVSLALVASGIILTLSYCHISNFEEVAAIETITVPAGCNATDCIRYNATGCFVLTVTVDKGIMNCTTLSPSMFSSLPQSNQDMNWFKWRHTTTIPCSPLYGTPSDATYLLLQNPEAYTKTVTVQVHRGWEGYNYLALLGGPLLGVSGFAMFYFANRRQIGEFNKALAEQET